MITVDGGDGGGQVLRTAIALSAHTDRPVTVENVRGDRDDPGLNHQHLAALRALARICSAEVAGDELNSETVTFEPGVPTGGEYDVEIETAGSVTLLFDAVLPLALRVSEPLTLRAKGGTDVRWSPPLDYFRHVKLPVLAAHGVGASLTPTSRGFYPEGGGAATLHLWPSDPSPIRLSDRLSVRRARVYSTASQSLAENRVARRQAETAANQLEGAEISVGETVVRDVETPSPGSVVVVALDGERGRAGFAAYGRPGRPSEDVAATAVEGAFAFLDGTAAVDEHLADQLLVFLALAGGTLRAPTLTDHVDACLDVLDQFDFPMRSRRVNGATEISSRSGR